MKQKTKTSKQSKENLSKASKAKQSKKTKQRQKIYIFKHEVICGSFSPQFKWSITLKGLRPVYIKDDNYKDYDKDIVLKNFSILKSPHHNENDKSTDTRYRWNRFQSDFVQLMNDTNFDTQSESILL